MSNKLSSNNHILTFILLLGSYLFITICVQSIVLESLAEEGELASFYEFFHIASHLIFTVTLWGSYYYHGQENGLNEVN